MFGDAEQSRDFTFVRNVVRASALARDSRRRRRAVRALVLVSAVRQGRR
jgi:nucleoside-diphosphate-sugar epimerase